jgi:RNA polymerase sigma-70 factor (ECF subfamily)
MNDRPDSDQAAGRSERFMRLLLPCYKRLEDFAFAMSRDPEEARDLVAETVLLAFESFDRLKDDQAFLGYLFTIASREFRRRRRRRRWFGAFDESAAERIVYPGSPPDIAADVVLLYRALAKLSEQQREAIVLFEISGFSMKEIQEIQGGSLSGVKVRIHRARGRLAELLGVPTDASSPMSERQDLRRDIPQTHLPISIETHLNS